MAREYFPAYHSYLDAMEALTDAERGRLFTACLIYSKTGEAPQLSGNERFVFPGMRSQIDRDNAEYMRKCATNKKNGELSGKRTPPNGTERPRTVPNAPQGKGKSKGKGKGKEEYPPQSPPQGGTAAKFTPPSVDEVRDYCSERKNGLDPAAFVDFYASKGWKVGSQRMKDWRAAVRTWERRRKEDENGTAAAAERTDADTFHGWRAKSALDDC